MKIDNLVFDCGWRKPTMINFQNQEIDIELVFDAYDDEELNDEQKNAYKEFCQHQKDYESKVYQLLLGFIVDNKIENPKVEAKTLYFNRNGEFALLCDCSWDLEHGIAIILSPIQTVTTQDNFL